MRDSSAACAARSVCLASSFALCLPSSHPKFVVGKLSSNIPPLPYDTRLLRGINKPLWFSVPSSTDFSLWLRFLLCSGRAFRSVLPLSYRASWRILAELLLEVGWIFV